jgi:hypothetical protein
MLRIFPYLFFLSAVAAIIASVSLSDYPHARTVFLERFAAEIERAERIPLETERSVREMIVSVRRNAPKPDSALANRQTLAIQRIEGRLRPESILAGGGHAFRARATRVGCSRLGQ